MSKSVYSLVLDDEIVEEINKMARINGISRSSMIEKILSSAVNVETPKIRATSIFDEIEKILSESRNMRYLSQQSQYMASIMSALDYRYNPAIRYSVELFPHSDHLGQLKVTLRTQNAILLNIMSDFYTLYSYLEKKYYNPNSIFMYDGAKFTRLFDFPKVNMTTKQLAELLTVYVKNFDELLNVYFNNLTTDENRLLYIIENKYKALKENSIVI